MVEISILQVKKIQKSGQTGVMDADWGTGWNAIKLEVKVDI